MRSVGKLNSFLFFLTAGGKGYFPKLFVFILLYVTSSLDLLAKDFLGVFLNLLLAKLSLAKLALRGSRQITSNLHEDVGGCFSMFCPLKFKES